jgi:hypothetical protein
MASPIMLVNFSVAPDVETAFTKFYHHEFLPTVLSHSPEIKNVRRYEEFAFGGAARWYNKQVLTIYQLAGAEAMANSDVIFARDEVKAVVNKFREWKEKSLRNFSRITFAPSWSHARTPHEGPFVGRPFFLWQLEMRPEADAEFQKWYEQTYLPLQIAEIPTWSGAVRYKSVEREPLRHLTVFEADNEAVLSRCLVDLRSAHRIEANLDWQQRVEPFVSWHDASSFRPIFRWPD